MVIDTLKILFERDLHKIKEEIALYKNEAAIWNISNDITNSAGNLCLHLIGNLNTYIGAVFANTGYIRDRPLEFSLTNVARKELLDKLDATIKIVDSGLSKVPVQDMQDDFPILIWDKPISIEFTLIHLCTHLSYHLGQINYHRRMLDV